MNQVLIASSIFLLTYILIVTEKMNRTLAALLGGLAMILFIVPQEKAFHAVDWNVIFLLAGMMVIANILKTTGLFQWIAVQAIRFGNDSPQRVLIILSIITAVTSAVLDNVTVVVLIAPVTLFIASAMRVSPVPFLIAEVLASNIGGMATLVGDPPNILIGSYVGIDFVTFAMNLAPISAIILIAFLVLSRFLFRKDFTVVDTSAVSTAELNASTLITDPSLLRKSLIVMAGVTLGFLFHGVLHLEPATIALTGATLLMLWTNTDPHYALRDIEWTTLFFFIGLFITVEAIVEAGVIDIVADAALRITEGNLKFTSILLIWFSAIASGIVDNIPYTATMLPIVESLGQTMPAMPLWWSLALGACLGGNFTIVGAAANVIVVSLAEKSGHPISFGQFFRYGAVTTIMSLVLATGYVWLMYL